jgi:hypothetical protein
MALRRSRRTVHIEGECGVEEALALVELLAGPAPLTVDLTRCTHLHTALVQVLAAGTRRRIMPPQDEFLARWLMPFLAPVSAEVPARRAARRGGATPATAKALVLA